MIDSRRDRAGAVHRLASRIEVRRSLAQCIAAFKFPGPSLSLARGTRAHLTRRATARSMRSPWCKSHQPAICISNNFMDRSGASVAIPTIGQIKAEMLVSISASSVSGTGYGARTVPKTSNKSEFLTNSELLTRKVYLDSSIRLKITKVDFSFLENKRKGHYKVLTIWNLNIIVLDILTRCNRIIQ